MLRDSVFVVVRRRPRAIPLAVIAMRKSTHGFPFVFHIWEAYGAPLGGPWGRRRSANNNGRNQIYCSRPNFRATNRRETLCSYETLATWVRFCDNEYEATNLGTKTVGEVSISFLFYLFTYSSKSNTSIRAANLQ